MGAPAQDPLRGTQGPAARLRASQLDPMHTCLAWLRRAALRMQEALRPFLADAAAALGADGGVGGGPLAAAFQSYWSPLPWKLVSVRLRCLSTIHTCNGRCMKDACMHACMGTCTSTDTDATSQLSAPGPHPGRQPAARG